MFNDAIGRAIAAAPTTELDHISQEVWRAHGSGLLDDVSATSALEAIQARRRAKPDGVGAPFQGNGGAPYGPANGRALDGAPTPKPRPRRQQSPDRRASIERRRRLVASGPLPPHLAARFTWGEQAVMRIVGDECRQYGTCSLHVDAIAARAGVHRTTVQNALREAQGRGPIPGQPIVVVQERRRRGQRSLTNVIRIVSKEWSTWLRRGPRRAVGPPSALGSNCTLSAENLSTTDTSKKERTDAPSRRGDISARGSPTSLLARGKEVALR